MADDEVFQGWSLDPSVRSAMRLDHLRKLVAQERYLDAVMEAEELLDDEPEHTEALELLARSSQALGDAEGARQALEQLLDLIDTPSAEVLSDLAAASLDCCDIDGAIGAARAALGSAAGLASAHYVLGLALEYKPGAGVESTSAMAAARSLDPATYPFPLVLEKGQWEAAVGTALRELHPRLQQFWDGIAVRLHERPRIERLTEADPCLSPRVFGLYQGSPDPELDPWQYRPEGLELYIRNLARTTSTEELVERIAHTLEHEALDWLGLAPDDLDDLDDLDELDD